MANAQMIQAIRFVLKACLDKLVIGILYDRGWNPLILNNRLCFSFQAIPDMELRIRAANSWNEYRGKFYAEFSQKWTLHGRESPAVETILMSLRQGFKGPKWDMKVNNLISRSTEKRFRLIAEGNSGEAEALNNALRKTVARITDFGLGDGSIWFEPTLAPQIPQPKKSKIKRQIGKGGFANAKKSTSRTDYGLGVGRVGSGSTSITQVSQPKESKIEDQFSEHVFAYANKFPPRTGFGLEDESFEFESTLIAQRSMVEGQQIFAHGRKFTPRTRINEAFAEAKLHPDKKARRRQSTLPVKLNNSETGSELNGVLDPDVVFVHTGKRAAAPRTKQESATLNPSNETGSHVAAVMSEPAKGAAGPLETAVQMAVKLEI